MHSHINRIASLACHEQAATTAYQKALNHASATHLQELRKIQTDHEEAACLLQSLTQDDGLSATQLGGWELLSKAVNGVEKLFGKYAALQTLHECEELAIWDYEECLRDNGIPYKSRIIIMKRLIPQSRDHIRKLKQLMQEKHALEDTIELGDFAADRWPENALN